MNTLSILVVCCSLVCLSVPAFFVLISYLRWRKRQMNVRCDGGEFSVNLPKHEEYVN